MKNLWAFFLAVLVLMFPLPVSAGERDIDNRVADIERDYGIYVLYQKVGEDMVAKQLSQIESALSCVGSDFARRMARHYAENTEDGELTILITDVDEHADAMNIGGVFSVWDNTIQLYVRPDYAIPCANIVHEFGHVYHHALPESDLDAFADVNGGSDSYRTVFKVRFNPSRYVTEFASTKSTEDFAETFMTMLFNGEARPTKAKQDSILYQKFMFIRNSLADTFGEDHYITRRASGFLGLTEAH